jgi:hypothetical protein
MHSAQVGFGSIDDLFAFLVVSLDEVIGETFFLWVAR